MMLSSSRKETMQERVAEAGEEAVRKLIHDPSYKKTLPESEMAQNMASDPNSGWPEERLQGSHLKDVLQSWMPRAGGGSSDSVLRHPGGHHKVSAKDPTHPPRATDEARGVNQSIGETLTGLNKRM